MFGEKARRIAALESQLALSERMRKSIEAAWQKDMEEIRSALEVTDGQCVLETIQRLKDRAESQYTLLEAAAQVIQEVEKHYKAPKKKRASKPKMVSKPRK